MEIKLGLRLEPWGTLHEIGVEKKTFPKISSETPVRQGGPEPVYFRAFNFTVLQAGKSAVCVFILTLLHFPFVI